MARSHRGPSEAEVRQQLEKMLAHSLFSQAERMSRFLRFVVEQTLEGKASELKEYTVALSVYDKDESFDPRTDPIVRVEAGRLRDRIAAYYRENESDPVLIRLRKRGYRPVIRRAVRKRSRDRAAIPSDNASVALSDRIVVLPFRDLSRDQSQEYFCEAITEQIAGLLSRLPGVQAAAHTSARQFSGTAVDVRRIGQELNVDLVLEGSVQRSGRHLRVNARLCRTDDGLQVWNHACDRELRDVLALQDDVAETVTANVQTMLGLPDKTGDEVAGDATRLCNLGIARQQREHEGDLDRTIDAFRKATQAPSCLARAWTGLAESLVNRMSHGLSDVARMSQEAIDAAGRAVDLDRNSGSAHAVLGATHVLTGGGWAEAEKEFQEALRLEPQLSLAHHWYGYFGLAPQGRLSDALSEVRMAVQLDPASLWANTNLAFIHYLLGNCERAIDQARYVREIEPRCRSAGWILGRCHAVSGRFDKSLEVLEWTADLRRHQPWTATRGYCYGKLGRNDEAHRLIADLRSDARRTAYAIAEIYLGLGEPKRALRWLHRAVEERIPMVTWLRVDPLFEDLHELAGFRELTSRLNVTATGARASVR